MIFGQLRIGARATTYAALKESLIFLVRSLTYIVVNTSMTVKLTVMMASKKKGLK